VAAAPASVWDPAARIKDQDLDGVQAEIIYTTLGMPLYGLDDGELRAACFRAYNDWAVEYCSYDPKRLLPLGLITLEDIGAGVEELRRIAKKGMRGAMIWAEPPHYASRLLDSCSARVNTRTPVAMDKEGSWRSSEDEICALHLRNLLEGRTENPEAARQMILAGGEVAKFGNAKRPWLNPDDVPFALDIDHYDFAIKVAIENGYPVARKFKV
jgi:hypothetical protein